MDDSSALDYLVAAYLNEDVFDFYPDVMAAVDDFVKHDRQDAIALPAEIDRVLATHSDNDIDEMLKSRGIGFVPGDLGYRGWLVKIADRVRCS
jgi:CdiI immunity protein